MDFHLAFLESKSNDLDSSQRLDFETSVELEVFFKAFGQFWMVHLTSSDYEESTEFSGGVIRRLGYI